MKSWKTAGPTALWVALGCAAFLYPHPAAADTVPQLIEKMADSGDSQEMRQICAQIQETNPKNYAKHFCEGFEAIFLGADGIVEESLDEALQDQPEFALAAILYGDAYASLGKTKLAERYYRRAIEIQPNRTDARYALGRLYFDLAKKGDKSYLPKALEAFREMAEADPSSPAGFTHMGHVLTYMGRYDDAETVYRKAISKSPSDPFLYDNLGALYARENRNKEAEQAWTKALQLNPSYGAAVVELAALYGRSGDLLHAIRVLADGEKAVVAPPWGPKIRRDLGFAFLGIGDLERARNQFIDAVATGSDDALSHLGLAHLRMIEGNTPEAIHAFRRGVALDPGLAAPFVLAWKSTIRFALEPGEEGGLVDLIGRLDAGETFQAEGESFDPRQVLGGASGPDANLALTRFVLEGWNFDNADLALEQIQSGGDTGLSEASETPPVPIQKVPAAYPERAQEQGIEGEVVVLVTVSPSGDVTDARIEKTTGDESLNNAALEAARQWKFKPGTRYGVPSETTIAIPFRFKRRTN